MAHRASRMLIGNWELCWPFAVYRKMLKFPVIPMAFGHGASRFGHAGWQLRTALAVCCLQENAQISTVFKGFRPW